MKSDAPLDQSDAAGEGDDHDDSLLVIEDPEHDDAETSAASLEGLADPVEPQPGDVEFQEAVVVIEAETGAAEAHGETSAFMPTAAGDLVEDADYRAGANLPRARIDDGSPLELDPFDPWKIHQADAQLRVGIPPEVAREQRADVILLGKANGRLLWIFIGLCALLVVGTFLNTWATLRMPAYAIPSTAQVSIYQRADHTAAEVESFADRIASRMENWNYVTIKNQSKIVLPYLDPPIRGQWEADFLANASDVGTYKERSLYESVATVYRGLKDDTTHQVLVFYQMHRGRGEHEGAIHFDAIVRRMKLLLIAEGAVNDENKNGMYILKHLDLPEKAYMEKFGTGGNPWDKALGIKAKKATAKNVAE